MNLNRTFDISGGLVIGLVAGMLLSTKTRIQTVNGHTGNVAWSISGDPKLVGQFTEMHKTNGILPTHFLSYKKVVSSSPPPLPPALPAQNDNNQATMLMPVVELDLP